MMPLSVESDVIFANYRAQILGKKMAPRLRRGPAVECELLQALQQGAGERIPVACSTLGHLRP